LDTRAELKALAAVIAVFLAAYFLPVGAARFDNAVLEALELAKWYAREHVLLCLVPAFFIAGAISVFISKEAVMRYLGAGASKILAYGVASVSGTILAVCSCTVLPMFASIYRRGAGLGPAIAFLYSGPAINVLAIILTARILGWEIGAARAAGAVIFSIVIGLAMAFLFRKDGADGERLAAAAAENSGASKAGRKLWQDALYLFSMVAFLVFANWANPKTGAGFFAAVFAVKWWLSGAALLLLAVTILLWFKRNELSDWTRESWSYAKQIFPLLFLGVIAAGFFLGRPGNEGVIPSEWISALVGGNGIAANLFAAIAGAFMYFATLTEVPILQGLIGSGMGKGPALAMLLAGPAVSLPSMLVINSFIGTKKTVAFVVLVVALATVSGWIFGALF
jgi:hypothetical protein